MSNLNHKAIIL